MPSIQTVLDDLMNGSVIGIGAKPPSNLTTTSTILSGTHRIKYSNLNIKASISNTNRLSCQASSSIDINGTYLHFEDTWSTITKIDILRPIVVSGNFSGCAYKVFRGQGGLICAHIARPSGIGAEANVLLINDYAMQKGWTEVQHIETAGLIRYGEEVVIVSQLIGGDVNSVLLKVNHLGLIIGRTLHQYI